MDKIIARMPGRPETEHERAAHLSALRLMGFHGGAFDKVCDAARCVRPAHWRYYPEANPLLAQVAIRGGAYEVYAVAGADGHPAVPRRGFCILRRVGQLYTVTGLVSLYADAVRLAAECGIDETDQHM